MQILNSSASSNAMEEGASGVRDSQQGDGPSLQDLLSQLTDYVKGTPGERLEKMILARLGVTQEDLKKMTPEEREKVMAKVREMLRKEMQAEVKAAKEQQGTTINLAV